MTLVAATGAAAVLPFVLLLACPLIMVFMMRGMHGSSKPKNLEELKRDRDALNAEIADRAEAAADEARGAPVP